MGTTVSTGDFFFSKEIANWITPYSPRWGCRAERLGMTVPEKQAQHETQGKEQWSLLLQGFFHIPCVEDC